MVSPQPQTNLRNAKEYFKIHFAAGDYCAVRSAQYLTQENAVVGEWFGQGAVRPNLAGNVTESAFVALCDDNDPATGERLTARRNNFRRQDGKLVANRRVCGRRFGSPSPASPRPGPERNARANPGSILGKPKLPDRSAVLLDEARQVGIRDLHRLVTTARKAGAQTGGED